MAQTLTNSTPVALHMTTITRTAPVKTDEHGTLHSIRIRIHPLDGADIRTDVDGWEHYGYRVTVDYQGELMWHVYRVGTGWTTAPTARQVLENMVDDFTTADAAEYEFDPEDYGYEPGSAQALRVERALHSHFVKMQRVFGFDLPAFLATFVDAYGEDVDPGQEAIDAGTVGVFQ